MVLMALAAYSAFYRSLLAVLRNFKRQALHAAMLRLAHPITGELLEWHAPIPQDMVETMRYAFRAANAKAEIIVYPEADHAFNADYRASYHEESAKDGWQRMLAWFAQYGGKRA